MDIKVLSISEISVFESACEKFLGEVEQIRSQVLSQTGILSESWKDDRFADFSGILDQIAQELENAQDIVVSLLLPYVQAKRRVMEDRT